MLKVDSLSFSFPQKDLYERVSFTLEETQHCAFIGRSGSGKTTLLHLLMDPERYTYDGVLEMEKQLKFGYVSQFSEPDRTKDKTVFEYMGETFLKLQNDIEQICAEMETSTELEPLLAAYELALDAFDAIGGEDFESQINRKLQLANLSKQKDNRVADLSGGEFKLVQVMKEMLLRPDLLIMDEPDAFLDFENLEALKNLMNAHKGALLVITHNRYLLNHCFNKILHLENRELQEFDGGYVEYHFSLLQTKIETQELNLADDEEIERNEKLIEKYREIATYNSEASRGKALKARVKVQERLMARRIKAPFVDIRQPGIRLKTSIEGNGDIAVLNGDVVVLNGDVAVLNGDISIRDDAFAIKVTDYSLAFDSLLLDHASFVMGPTDKVALIGSNGTGKTTLLREIHRNRHEAIERHGGLKTAYLSQLQGEMLDEDNSILQEFFDAGFKTLEDILEYAAVYGFEGDIVQQKISTLSGGEKNLLQLAKIAAGTADLLLLDEPSSHLDTYAQLALETAIQQYKGAVLMVSHDFFTIANCMDYVLLIEDKSIRKMSMRKFRKMIYANHYGKDYIEIEKKKKTVESKIDHALKGANFELAKKLSEELETLIGQLKAAYASA